MTTVNLTSVPRTLYAGEWCDSEGLTALGALGAGISIQGVSVNPLFRYRASDIAGVTWPSWGYGATLALTGAGAAPAATTLPCLGGESCCFFTPGAKVWTTGATHPFNFVALKDIILEAVLVLRYVDAYGAASQRFMSTQAGADAQYVEWSTKYDQYGIIPEVAGADGTCIDVVGTFAGSMHENSLVHVMLFWDSVAGQSYQTGHCHNYMQGQLVGDMEVNGCGIIGANSPLLIGGDVANGAHGLGIVYLAAYAGASGWFGSCGQTHQDLAMQRAQALFGWKLATNKYYSLPSSVSGGVGYGSQFKVTATTEATAIQEVHSSGPRTVRLVDANGTAYKGMLSEPKRINWMPWSKALTGWSTHGAPVHFSMAGEPGPNGDIARWERGVLGARGVSDFYIARNGVAPAGAQIQPSLSLRPAVLGGTLVIGHTTDEALGKWTIDLGAVYYGCTSDGSWARIHRGSKWITVVNEFIADPSGNIGMQIYSAGAPITVDVDNAQLEVGDYATSPIITTGGTWAGVWNAITTYNIYDIVQGSDRLLYSSLLNANTNNALTDPHWWTSSAQWTRAGSLYVLPANLWYPSGSFRDRFVAPLAAQWTPEDLVTPTGGLQANYGRRVLFSASSSVGYQQYYGESANLVEAYISTSGHLCARCFRDSGIAGAIDSGVDVRDNLPHVYLLKWTPTTLSLTLDGVTTSVASVTSPYNVNRLCIGHDYGGLRQCWPVVCGLDYELRQEG